MKGNKCIGLVCSFILLSIVNCWGNLSYYDRLCHGPCQSLLQSERSRTFMQQFVCRDSWDQSGSLEISAFMCIVKIIPKNSCEGRLVHHTHRYSWWSECVTITKQNALRKIHRHRVKKKGKKMECPTQRVRLQTTYYMGEGFCFSKKSKCVHTIYPYPFPCMAWTCKNTIV